MIENLNGLKVIKQLLLEDAPTTEIFDVIDILEANTQNFDAAIYLTLSENNTLLLNVSGDKTSECYVIAVIHLFDVINDKLNGLLVEKENEALRLESV